MGGLSILYTLHNGATLFMTAQGAAVPHWDKWYAGKIRCQKCLGVYFHNLQLYPDYC